MEKKLSVIIPAYNEEDRIRATIGEVAGYLSGRGYEFEIIVVDDGSTDGTAREVLSLDGAHPQVRFFHRPQNLGKGETVKEGIGYARLPLCLFMDADNATRIEEWDKFEKEFEKGARVVVASRHLAGSRIVHPQPAIRRYLGAGYRAICRAFFGLRVSDFNCGFKAYETGVAKAVYQKVAMRDWSFDTEVFCLLKRERVAVSEVPVQWEHREKKSNLKPVVTAFKTLRSIIALKIRYPW